MYAIRSYYAKAIIVGFNVSADSASRRTAEAEGVSIRWYQIIYRLIEDVEKALKGMLEPEYVEVTLGKAEVLAIFKIQKIGAIAGCKITSGEFRRNAKARVIRNEEVV